MAKLSKAELAAHRAAVALLESGRPLSLDDCHQVLEYWHEGAGGDQTAAGAFFTPCDMASDLLFEMPHHGTFVDLCAGTGRLAYLAGGQGRFEPHRYSRIVCVERNPAYVAVGKRVLPDAEWICGDVLDPAVRRQIGQVDFAISNPPFGAITKSEHRAPRYHGQQFDLAVCDVAAAVAPSCWAIVPQSRARWDYRGNRQESRHADAFLQATGLDFWRFSSLDPAHYRPDWRGTAPAVEIVGFGDEYEAERATHRTIHAAAPKPLPACIAAPAHITQQPTQLALL